MRSNLKLATGDPPRSPERQTLAEAIERHREATAHLASLQAALSNISEQIFGDAGVALRQAEVALQEAQAGESRHLAAVALGQVTADVDPIKAATQAVDDARANVDKLRKTRAALEAEAKATERAIMFSEIRRDAAVDVVVKADVAVELLAEKFVEAEKLYFSLRQSMGVVGTARLPESAKFWDCAHGGAEPPSGKLWRAAIEALASDADAALPS